MALVANFVADFVRSFHSKKEPCWIAEQRLPTTFIEELCAEVVRFNMPHLMFRNQRTDLPLHTTALTVLIVGGWRVARNGPLPTTCQP